MIDGFFFSMKQVQIWAYLHTVLEIGPELLGKKWKKDAIFPWSSSPTLNTESGQKFLTSAHQGEKPLNPQSWLCWLQCQSTGVHHCLLILCEKGSSIPNYCSLEQLLHRWDWGASTPTISKTNPAQLAGSGSQLAKHSRTQPDVDTQWVPEEFQHF